MKDIDKMVATKIMEIYGMGNVVVHLLCRLFNSVLKTETMPSEWRRSIALPMFNTKEEYTGM